jgi:high-affinity iron transporter
VGGAGAASVLAGATVGLLISAGLGYGLYRGSRRLNLGRFFRWTGVLLVFIAAGLLGSAVHEFVEIGWITLGTQTAFDISATLPHEAGIGLFLRALFGYSSTPEVAALATWVTYLVVVLSLYLRPLPQHGQVPVHAGHPRTVR